MNVGGFLLKRLIPNDVRQAIDFQENVYFVAKDSRGETVGYIELRTQFPNEVLKDLEWVSAIEVTLVLFIPGSMSKRVGLFGFLKVT